MIDTHQTVCTCGRVVNLAPGICIFCGRMLADGPKFQPAATQPVIVLVSAERIVEPEEALRVGPEAQGVELRGRNQTHNQTYSSLSMTSLTYTYSC